MTADPGIGGEDNADRFAAALAMADFAEQNGFDHVSLEEHHCAENGWLPSPLTMAAMIAARTERVSIGVTALLVTLYDPVRLAEDIAVIDLVARGRFSFVAGQGYRPVEYHALDKDWLNRGQAMDELVDTLLKAWSGEPFEYKGQTIRVTPTPYSQPHPPFFIGGMSSRAARRAARFGLPFYPPMPRPDLEQVYYQALEEYGNKGFYYAPDAENAMTFLHEHPDLAWEQLGSYFLQEMREYSNWKVDGVKRPSEMPVCSIDDVRQSGRFEIITPSQCVARFTENPGATLVFHPLAGGVPLEQAWQSLKLYRDQVRPAIAR